jgi:basic membrane protein A
LPNVLGLQFPSEEPGYLAGVAAALTSKTGTVSTVGGVKIPSVDNWIAGFQQGVKDTKPDVKVLKPSYSQDFVDQAKCKEIALDQIAQGSDIVFQVAGLCGFGAIDAACQEGVYAIGVDADQSNRGDCVIFSALKPLEVAVFETIEAAQEGTFEGGQNRLFGVEDFPEAELLTPFTDVVPQEAQDAVAAADEKLRSGEIDPPATLEEVK